MNITNRTNIGDSSDIVHYTRSGYEHHLTLGTGSSIEIFSVASDGTEAAFADNPVAPNSQTVLKFICDRIRITGCTGGEIISTCSKIL